MKIAKEKGLPVLKHHLIPRAKGIPFLTRTIFRKLFSKYSFKSDQFYLALILKDESIP